MPEMIKNEVVDACLISELQSGSEIAFRKIYHKTHAKLYGFIFSFIRDRNKSEELLQETFVSLWVNRIKLDANLPLYPYLYLTAKRLTIDAFRKNCSELYFKEAFQRLQSESTTETEDHILAADLGRITREAVSRLPKQQRIIFQLSRMDGLSYDEIAAQLNLSRNTVRNHLVCALKSLKAHLVKHDITYGFLFFFLLN